MSRIETERKSAIRRGTPVSLKGLIFYPVKMTHYEEFQATKDAVTLRQGTLPAKYLAMPFISAIYRFEYDSITSGGAIAGLFDRLLRFLYLTLRIEYDREEALGNIFCEAADTGILSRIVVCQNGNTVEITPMDFSAYIRPLIAEQNGLKLPDESDNLELVRAGEELNRLAARGCELDYNADTLRASVAYNSRVSERELDEWTVREFEYRRRAIERDKRFMIYALAESAGLVTFKKGNPVPSWCFDKADGLCSGATPLSVLNANKEVLGDIHDVIGYGGAQKQ